MPKFNFIVRDASGKTITGQLAMDSKDQLVTRLKDQGYYINKITEVKEDSLYHRIDTAFQRLTPIKLKDISIFTRLLSTMINAGLPILRSLKIIEKQTENLRLVEVIQSIRDQVEEGHALSLAMSKHSVFDPLIIAMVKSGEESGSLDIVLDRISHDKERDIEYIIHVTVDNAIYKGSTVVKPGKTYTYIRHIYPQQLDEGKVTFTLYEGDTKEPVEQVTYYISED